jgi:hypothetical protein
VEVLATRPADNFRQPSGTPLTLSFHDPRSISKEELVRCVHRLSPPPLAEVQHACFRVRRRRRVWAEQPRFDAIRWMTARMAPKKYRERVLVEAEVSPARAMDEAERGDPQLADEGRNYLSDQARLGLRQIVFVAHTKPTIAVRRGRQAVAVGLSHIVPLRLVGGRHPFAPAPHLLRLPRRQAVGLLGEPRGQTIRIVAIAMIAAPLIAPATTIAIAVVVAVAVARIGVGGKGRRQRQDGAGDDKETFHLDILVQFPVRTLGRA